MSASISVSVTILVYYKTSSFTHLVAIRLLQAIQNLEGKYFHFHGIHIFQNLTEYVTISISVPSLVNI